MFYKTGYCFTSRELYDTLNLKLLNISTKIVRKYKMDCLQDLCGAVLTYCLYLIILDIIENNITFVLPLFGNREACFYVKMFDGEDFQKAYKAGKFLGIDFLSSNFKGYQIYFQYKYNGGWREKPIYINHTLKDKFYENINNGKQYY